MKDKDRKEGYLRFLVVLSALYTIYFAKAVLFPICLSAVLFFLLAPTIRLLAKIKIPRVISAGVVIISFVLMTGYMTSRLIGPASKWLDKAPATIGALERKLLVVKTPMEQISNATKKVENIAELSSNAKEKVEVKISSKSLKSTFFDYTSDAITTFLTAILLLYFLLVYGDRLIRACEKYLAPRTESERELIRKVESGVSTYLMTTTSINLTLGIVIGTVLWFLKVPNAPLWGAMACCLNFIPYVGALAGTAIVAVVSVISFDSPLQTMLPPLAYFGISALEGQVITPILFGRTLRLNPFIILLSMVTWGWAWGIGGALLSVPLVAIFKIVCDSVDRLNHIGKILES